MHQKKTLFCIYFFLLFCSFVLSYRKKHRDFYRNKSKYKIPFKIHYEFKRNEYTIPDIFDENSVIMRNPDFDLSPRFKTNNVADVFPMQVSCGSSNVTSALKELRQKIKCTPRNTIVNLKAPQGFMVSPNVVLVKKCGGMCPNTKSCLSNETKEKSFFVRSVNFQTNDVICSSILVPEDTSCKCGCETKMTDCLPTQNYDKNMCVCRCKDLGVYQKCISMKHLNFKWDEKTCSCVCETTKVCTTGSHWVPNQCRCEKLYP